MNNKKIIVTKIHGMKPLLILFVIMSIMWVPFAIFFLISAEFGVGSILLLLVALTFLSLFIYQCVGLSFKHKVIKCGKLKNGKVVSRRDCLIDHSKFIVEFENQSHRKVRTQFLCKTYAIYDNREPNELVHYDEGDIIPLYVYGNYGLYDYEYNCKLNKKKDKKLAKELLKGKVINEYTDSDEDDIVEVDEDLVEIDDEFDEKDEEFFNNVGNGSVKRTVVTKTYTNEDGTETTETTVTEEYISNDEKE